VVPLPYALASLAPEVDDWSIGLPLGALVVVAFGFLLAQPAPSVSAAARTTTTTTIKIFFCMVSTPEFFITPVRVTPNV
jgi:hypothetical protein